MRWQKVWRLLCTVGLPWGIITAAIGTLLKYCWIMEHPRSKLHLRTFEDFQMIALFAAATMFLVFIKNLHHIGKEDIGLFTWVHKAHDIPPSPEKSPERIKAQQTEIPDIYKSQYPLPFTIGTIGKGKKRQYFRIRLDQYLSSIVIGSSGSGKSTILRTLVLEIIWKRNIGRRPSLWVYDYKGDLYHGSCMPKCMPNRKGVKFLSLGGEIPRQGGWDVFYKFHRKDKPPSDDDILEELTLISSVVITDSKGEGGSEGNSFFFYENGRSIFIWTGYIFVKLNKSFLALVDFLYDGDLRKKLKELVNNVKHRPDMKIAVEALEEFISDEDEGGADMLKSIMTTVKTRLRCFKLNNLRYALEYCPKEDKISPYTLEEEGTAVFFYPGRIKSTEVVLKLIAKQLEDHCCNRDFMNLDGTKKDLHQIIVCIDEVAKLGGTLNLEEALQVIRGFRVSYLVFMQSIHQLSTMYGADKMESIIDDVNSIVVLAVNSVKSAEKFVDVAGEYMERSRSKTIGGSNDGSVNESFSHQKILTNQTFLSLKRDKKAIVLTDGQFFLVDDTEAARYYKIPKLNQISEMCENAHREAYKQQNQKG